MKKPIVAEYDIAADERFWRLPRNIEVAQRGIELADGLTHVRIRLGQEEIGPLPMKMAQEIFNVILYPPDSVPSPEPANPDINVNYEVRDKAFDEVIDIPRQDLPPK